MNYKGVKDKEYHCLNCNKIIPFKGYGFDYKYCNQICQQDLIYKNSVELWLNKKINGNFNGKNYDIKSFVRKYLFKKFNNKCEKCGWGITNTFTNKIPLNIHHIDGNCLNSYIENLQLLCPNCHSLTETHGSKNKGNSKRIFR